MAKRNSSAGTPKAPRKERRTDIPFWTRLLTGKKVHRTLQTLGVSVDTFEAVYGADKNRVRRDISDRDRQIVKDFLSNGMSVATAKEALGIKTDQTFIRFLERVKATLPTA